MMVMETSARGPPISVGSQPVSIATGDFNGDGKMDLVCANSGAGTLQVLTNNGNGRFSESATINVSGGVGWVIATDVDRNGSIDLVSANGSSIDTYINDGHGKFTLKFTTPAVGTVMIAAADMNSDGRIDLVGFVNGNGIRGSGIVLTNDGRGKFTVDASVPIGVTDWGPIGELSEFCRPRRFQWRRQDGFCRVVLRISRCHGVDANKRFTSSPYCHH